MTGENKKEQELQVKWACRVHPVDWSHEVGCPHMEWTREQLLNALITKKRFEEAQWPSTGVYTVPKANSVSQTSPTESASVIPQSLNLEDIAKKIGRAYNSDWWRAFEILKVAFPPVPVSDLESEWTAAKLAQLWSESDGYYDGNRWWTVAHAVNASLRQLREQKEKVEQRLAALRKDHEDATDNYEYDRETLNATLLQHESVIEKMREAINRFFQWAKCDEVPEDWPRNVEDAPILPDELLASVFALQPTDSLLAAYVESKLQPLVEALEKISRWRNEAVQETSDEPWFAAVARQALAQLKPETKL